MMPFFSIIIPVYNVAPYLRECLDSVLAQTFTDWEAICVDDGSTDDSGVILDEYAEKDDRIRAVHQLNAGVSAARNLALDLSRGENILFLDADDVYLSRLVFERVKEELELSRTDDLIVFGYQTFCETGSQLLGKSKSIRKSVDISKRIYSPTLKILFWEACYRRDIVRDIRFPNRTLGEDMVFIGEVLCKVNRINYIDEIFYGYRVRSGSASHGQSTFRKFSEIIELNRFWLKRFADSGKLLTIGAYDYIAQWLFEWNPQRLRALEKVEREAAIDKLRQLYRQFGEARGNRLRYRLAVKLGESLKSYWVTCLLSGKMPRPHFGLMVACKKGFSALHGLVNR